MGGRPAVRRVLAVAAIAAVPGLAGTGRAEGQEDRSGAPLATAASRIEALAAPQADAGLFSGVILVARGRQVLVERAYGRASWEAGAPNTPSTRFGIASITKALTETLVRVLEAEGRLDLDAPVERYLPGFPRGPEGGAPTLRHLLDHRAGVPHRLTEPWEESRYVGPAEMVERARSAGLLFEPGSRRLYSSAGYTCLARVVEVAEGRPFEEVLRERVFAPASMDGAVSETGPRLMPGRALPHRLGADDGEVVVRNSPPKDLRFLTGAGSVYATGRDLVGFVASLSSGDFGSGLREEVFGGDPEEWRGWAGRTNGYEAWVDVHPGRDLVFVLLSNLQSAANWQLHEQIRNALTGRPTRPIPFPPPVAAPFEEPGSIVGTFGPAEIAWADGMTFRGDNEFYPIDGRRYYIPASGTTMRFRRDATGRVDALVSTRGGGGETVIPRSGGG